jgi:hypothetical protein
MEPRGGTRRKLKPRRIVTTARQDGLRSTLTDHVRDLKEEGRCEGIPEWSKSRNADFPNN